METVGELFEELDGKGVFLQSQTTGQMVEIPRDLFEELGMQYYDVDQNGDVQGYVVFGASTEAKLRRMGI